MLKQTTSFQDKIFVISQPELELKKPKVNQFSRRKLHEPSIEFQFITISKLL